VSADLAAQDSASLVSYHASAAGWWPQGDPGRLRVAAAAWRAAAADVDAVADRGRRLAWELRALNSGQAIDAFTRFWGRAETHLSDQAAAARELAHRGESYAHAIDRARAEIMALRTAEVAVAVAGLVLAVVTVGASEVAAGAAALGTVAAIEAAQATLVETVLAIVGRIALSAATSAAGAAVEDLVVQAIPHQYDPVRPFDWGESLAAATSGAEAGAAFGSATELGAVAGRLARTARRGWAGITSAAAAITW